MLKIRIVIHNTVGNALSIAIYVVLLRQIYHANRFAAAHCL